jgi:DMSO/TMAO reductase YedYZ molybdopterin-dependent catalytic subunit
MSYLDRKPLPYDAVKPELVKLERRLLLRGSLSLGALTLLGGCELDGDSGFDAVLKTMSRFNDKIQAALFSPARLAPTYPASMITKPFPFNAYYTEDAVRTVDAQSWRLEVGGLVDSKQAWSLADLRAMPQHSQITRHICVEGWSAIGQWSGPRFSDFLARVGADARARYVGFKCFDDYFTSIDMATALHPQTIMALDYGGAPLPPRYGAPLKLRIPTKLGFKNPKYISAIYVTNDNPGGYWENQGYNWFSGS